jgi:PAS domain S-box-containing protein
VTPRNNSATPRARGGERSSSPVARKVFDRVFVRYAFAALTVAVAFGLKKVLEPVTGTGAPFVLFFAAVLVTTLLAGPWPGLIATLLSSPLGAYMFVVRAGYTPSQAAFQAALFAVDGLVVVYLSFIMMRARRAAETSTAHLRDLIELAPDSFFLADLDGRFTDVNQAACRMLGYEREELVGKTIFDIIPAEDAPRLEEVRASLLAPGQLNRAEWTHKRKDGTLVPVEVSSNILPGGRWQAFVRDISQRRRLQDDLRESENKFHTLAEAVPQIVWITRPDGWNTYFNQQWVAYTGLTLEQSRGHGWNIPFHPEDRQRAWDAWQRAVQTDGVYSLECRLRRADGVYRWWLIRGVSLHDQNGQVINWFGTCTDVDDIKRTEEALRRARDEAQTANQQLRESEERFRLTIDEAPIGMALVALDGRFARVNAALCEILGYTAAELLRLRFQDITHPADLGSDLALADRLARGEIPRYQLEKRYIRKNGALVTIMLSASILRGTDGTPLYYIAQVEDITERKRAEEALRSSEARFSGIISISPDAIISVDGEQRIILFNDGAERIFGYSRADAIGAPLGVLIPERLRTIHGRHVASFAAGEMTARQMGARAATIVGQRKNGEEFPAEAAISKLTIDGQAVLTVAVRDITERKRIEAEQRFLADAGAVLASSLDYEQTLTTLGHLAVRELADWCIVDLVEEGDRPRRLRVVSGDPDQASLAAQFERLPLDRHRPHLALPPLETRRPFLIERMTPERLASFAQSDEHLHKLRAMDPRSVMGLPLLIRGQLLGVLVFISSTPSRVYGPADLRLAEALADRAALAIENGRLYRASVHATRLREEILGVVAHDLRNPLAAIVMHASALQRRAPEPERRNDKPRESILRAANRMDHLIRDLLDVSLIEAGYLGVGHTRVPARQLLLDSVEAQRPLASSASLDLQLELAGDLPDVSGDQHRLFQVLENLVGNAIKFTPEGGRITVGAAPREHEVLFWVADTGYGISPEGLPHVFDRFWQAKKGARQGAGLGLAITRGIVEAHGGRIWVESTLGRGTIFFFTIPEAPTAEAPRPDAVVAHSG